MKKLISIACVLFCSAGLLTAQDPTEPEDPSRYEDLVAHLNLTDFQVMCLQSVKDSFRDAAAPTAEELRAGQRSLREAARAGEDTTALKADVEALADQIKSVRAGYVVSAQACLDTTQQALLGELIAAETLMQEVRQSIGLLLIEPTEERTTEGRVVRRRPGRR